ncbi:hypothetical protein GTY23_42735, partial [Streptomyces sp. SID5998]|nr:hypothetical protein [Streptomyces sp. SID5998]
RAANAAESLAKESAQAAYDARDAANSAATHADNAADAAEEAAKHAGESSKAAAEAAKQASRAKEAADTATNAAATAHKVFTIARKTEAEDLATRANAAMESAQSHKDATDVFTSQLAQVALEDKRIGEDTAELAAEAGRPGADTRAVAAKGRAVALRALKQYGAWRQEAAARALAGDDDAVLDYLRRGAKQAETDEIRQQVTDLAQTSPYESVRAGATQALGGSDEQIRDFYTRGQYTVATADYRVLVSQINNAGGPAVKDASKAALADGSPTAMREFLNGGRYQARNQDERVQASKLVNDGGPEVRAAAKIALSGPADQLHEFIQVGQYMADRKDKLAETHAAQMQRLLNEADGIAASARKDSWLAAKAAATAKNAKDEANKAAAEAKKNADQAGKYADDAKKSADQAQNSASQAADSARTARNASDRADQDAADADESASQAAWSADYARDSAHAADDAAAAARASAFEAGKSAAEAKSEASKAWSDVASKRRAEEAAARQRAEEQRKQRREQERQAKNKKHCVAYMTRDSLPPCALAGQPLELPTPSPDLAKLLIEGGMEVLGVTDLLDCAENPTLGKCTLAVAGVLPIGKLKLLKKAADGVEDLAKASRAAKAAEKCFQCFLAGTDVLMADGSTRKIESVRVGDSVLATDPLTGLTGPRRVTDRIVTEHDKRFDELTLHTRNGSEHLTATDEHPFWSPSSRSWVEARNLRTGATLRTVDGSTVDVLNNRSFEKSARTYNLSVAELHTYYVMAGRTPVLVHNSEVCLKGVDDAWHAGTFENPGKSFRYHWEKHGEPLNITPEKYLKDSSDWAKRLAEPGGKKGYNAKRMPFDDGKWGVKYSDPHGGVGGIIGPDGRVVSFWYDEAH